MNTPKSMLEYVKAQPFRPFRIQMASGRTFDIRHPEMVKVGKNDLVVFFPVSDNPDIHDDWSTVSLLLVESVTHLDASVTQSQH